MRKLALLILLASALMWNGCSSSGSDSPSDNEAHPTNWFSNHGPEAEANPGYIECTTCHGADLHGEGDAVSCYSCHSYSAAPPFTIHPASWTAPYTDHRAYAAINGYQSCKSCHGSNLQGYQVAPSCYSASYNGQSCHADGPQGAPHPLDGSYLRGSNHGPDAKANLTECQQCHGQPGGPGSNPRFNIGIVAAGNQGCEGCHGVDYAHPAKWAGPNNTFHYTAGSIQQACTLCHGVSLDGVGGVGVSCLGCHISTTTFALNCAFCHVYPPDGAPDVATDTGVNHARKVLPGTVSDIGGHLVCSICHGVSESPAVGTFQPIGEYTLFNYQTDTNGDHWDGNIDMNQGTQYNQNNFGCDAAGCHGNNPAHQLSDSGLPVVLKFFTR
jgi:hypothetical protein